MCETPYPLKTANKERTFLYFIKEHPLKPSNKRTRSFTH